MAIVQEERYEEVAHVPKTVKDDQIVTEEIVSRKEGDLFREIRKVIFDVDNEFVTYVHTTKSGTTRSMCRRSYARKDM